MVSDIMFIFSETRRAALKHGIRNPETETESRKRKRKRKRNTESVKERSKRSI